MLVGTPAPALNSKRSPSVESDRQRGRGLPQLTRRRRCLCRPGRTRRLRAKKHGGPCGGGGSAQTPSARLSTGTEPLPVPPAASVSQFQHVSRDCPMNRKGPLSSLADCVGANWELKTFHEGHGSHQPFCRGRKGALRGWWPAEGGGWLSATVGAHAELPPSCRDPLAAVLPGPLT